MKKDMKWEEYWDKLVKLYSQGWPNCAAIFTCSISKKGAVSIEQKADSTDELFIPTPEMIEEFRNNKGTQEFYRSDFDNGLPPELQD
jgi:hypothetical protein